MKLADADQKKLLPLLDELSRAVEDLLLSGLTTASEATRQTLNVTFQEAARMRLLKLGSTLHIAGEELGRFTRNEAEFSRQRLSFFLNRAWMLCHGLARALRANDEKAFERLLWVPPDSPVARLDVVTLGVVKKMIQGAACTFEFRLRLVKPSGKLKAGQSLRWSCVFPVKPGATIPAEGYLQLPQKQKFKAAEFLGGKEITIEQAAVALDEVGGRINLGEQSKVTSGSQFSDWEQFQTWDLEAALKRVRDHQVGPFDLEIEMQEEVVLPDWSLEKPTERGEGQTVFALLAGAATFEVVLQPNAEGNALKKVLGDLRKLKKRPPLFGLMHYERCRLVLQPLTIFDEKKGLEHLMISDDQMSRKELLKTLNLTS